MFLRHDTDAVVMNAHVIAKILWLRRQFRRHDHWTRQQLEAYQARALQRLREYAYAASPFYQRFHQGCTTRPLQELPVLTKALLMEHFDEVVTDRTVRLREVEAFLATAHGSERFRDRYWVNATSGSTGRRGLFLFDRTEWITVLTSYARVYEWGGVQTSLTRRTKMAVVSTTTPWHQSAQVGATVQSWWSPTLEPSELSLGTAARLRGLYDFPTKVRGVCAHLCFPLPPVSTSTAYATQE